MKLIHPGGFEWEFLSKFHEGFWLAGQTTNLLVVANMVILCYAQAWKNRQHTFLHCLAILHVTKLSNTSTAFKYYYSLSVNILWKFWIARHLVQKELIPAAGHLDMAYSNQLIERNSSDWLSLLHIVFYQNKKSLTCSFRGFNWFSEGSKTSSSYW